MSDYFKRVQSQTRTRFWINNVTVNEAHMAIAAGAVGCTQNPSYSWKILNGADRDFALGLIDQYIDEGLSNDDVLVKLQRTLVERIAEIFMPMYEASHGKLGYVSIQGNPFREDAVSIVNYGRFNREKYPNIMIKVPVTVDGLEAIDTLLHEGAPINATEVMAVRQAVDLCHVYEKAAASIEHPPVTYYSHIAGIFDEHLKATVESAHINISPDVLWQAGIIVAKKVNQITKTHWPEVGMISGGARGLQHFTEMVGGDAAVTINWVGTADKLLEQDAPVVPRFTMPPAYEAIDELFTKLPDFRKAYFIDEIRPEEYESFGPVVRFRNSFESAWTKALAAIEERRTNR